MMDTIRPREMLQSLEAIAVAEGVDLEAVDVVPSIQSWCKQHGLDEPNLNRMGKTVRNLATLRPRILLAEEITASMQNGVIFVLDSRGFGDETEQLEDSQKFLVHLFLHELAHAKDDRASEDDCDRFAFSRLRHYDRSGTPNRLGLMEVRLHPDSEDHPGKSFYCTVGAKGDLWGISDEHPDPGAPDLRR